MGTAAEISYHKITREIAEKVRRGGSFTLLSLGWLIFKNVQGGELVWWGIVDILTSNVGRAISVAIITLYSDSNPVMMWIAAGFAIDAFQTYSRMLHERAMDRGCLEMNEVLRRVSGELVQMDEPDHFLNKGKPGNFVKFKGAVIGMVHNFPRLSRQIVSLVISIVFVTIYCPEILFIIVFPVVAYWYGKLRNDLGELSTRQKSRKDVNRRVWENHTHYEKTLPSTLTNGMAREFTRDIVDEMGKITRSNIKYYRFIDSVLFNMEMFLNVLVAVAVGYLVYRGVSLPVFILMMKNVQDMFGVAYFAVNVSRSYNTRWLEDSQEFIDYVNGLQISNIRRVNVKIEKLEIEKAEYTYPAKDDKSFTVKLLSAVNLAAGCYRVVGANGHGKSTFFRILSGVCKATDSIIRVNRRLVESGFRGISLTATTSLIQGEKTINPERSIAWNITGRERDYNIDTLLQALKIVGMTHDENVDCNVGKLSGGQRQYLKIASAIYNVITNRSSILILDEANSDINENEELNPYTYDKVIASIRDALPGIFIFVTLHSETLSGRIHFDGKFVFESRGQIIFK